MDGKADKNRAVHRPCWRVRQETLNTQMRGKIRSELAVPVMVPIKRRVEYGARSVGDSTPYERTRELAPTALLPIGSPQVVLLGRIVDIRPPCKASLQRSNIACRKTLPKKASMGRERETSACTVPKRTTQQYDEFL